MKIIKLIIFVLILSAPFLLNVVRKNIYFSKSCIVFELNEIIKEKEREYMELKGKYNKIFSPTNIEELGGKIGLRKPQMKDYLILR
jgi:hypothetical protein|uniref:Cell division protein FtsL n=1 Tax=candidate division WOR-3 bacterium TaxID=2052148 RepID=A0A7C4U690_UNCW3